MKNLGWMGVLLASLGLAAPAAAQPDLSSELSSINADCEREAAPIVLDLSDWDAMVAVGAEPGFIAGNAVDAVVAMCGQGRGLTERREYDVGPVRRAIAANLDVIRIELRPDWESLAGMPAEVADKPLFSFEGGVWTVGIAPTTTTAHDDWYYYYLGFEAPMPIDGVPLAEAREHSLAQARVDAALATAEAECGVDLEMELDFGAWTGRSFNLPWVTAYDSPINNHFGPDALGDMCSSILLGYAQECYQPQGREFAARYPRVRCVPDPMAEDWNDPSTPPLNYEMELSTPEGAPFWTLDDGAGELVFYLWAGSYNSRRDTEVMIQDGDARRPARCRDLPEYCEGDGPDPDPDPDPTDPGSPGAATGCHAAPTTGGGGAPALWLGLFALVARTRRRSRL